MSDDRLEELGQKIDKAKEEAGLKPPLNQGENEGSGLAYRIAIELFAGIAVGGFIGWYLDKWLNTSPFIFITMLLFGAGAGFLNIYKLAMRGDSDSKKGS